MPICTMFRFGWWVGGRWQIEKISSAGFPVSGEVSIVLVYFTDGVVRASSEGMAPRERVERTLFGPAHHIGARGPSRKPHGWGMGDQLQLGDEVNSEIADRYYTGSSARHVVAVGDLPTSSASAPQLVPEYMGSRSV